MALRTPRRGRGFRRLEPNGWRNVCEVRGSGAVCWFGETKLVLRCESLGHREMARGFSPRKGGFVQWQIDIFVGKAPDVLAAGLIAGGDALSCLWAIGLFSGSI